MWTHSHTHCPIITITQTHNYTENVNTQTDRSRNTHSHVTENAVKVTHTSQRHDSAVKTGDRAGVEKAANGTQNATETVMP